MANNNKKHNRTGTYKRKSKSKDKFNPYYQQASEITKISWSRNIRLVYAGVGRISVFVF